MSKRRREAVKLMVKGIEIMMKLEGRSLSEKRKLKREDESVEQYVERIERINEEAIVTAVKSMIEE